MSTRNWTPEQKNAIYARGGSVLVSAAAGSGKTAVLVERVIQMVCDSVHPVGLDRLLIVTFTKAAAAEMRERIGKALEDCLALDPENAYLLRQQILLPSAEICTMDSFCNALVKRQFHLLAISPDFRILDDSERRALEEETVSECIAELYEKGGEVFSCLSDLFLLGASDRALKDTILELYRYAQAYPFPEVWLSAVPTAYDPETPLVNTLWGKEICKYLSAQIGENLRVLENAVRMLGDEPALAESYLPALQTDLQYNRRIGDALSQNDWNTAKALIEDYAPARLSAAPRAYSGSAVKTAVTAMRDKAKKSLQGLPKYLPATTAEHKQDMQYLQPIVALLCETAAAFSEKLLEKKRAGNAFDFNDISHMALSLLTQRQADGTVVRTPLAVELSEKYEEILLDEYQDTNEAQDMLFSAISREERNLFTVGDVKQSIYGFRLAMPEIFMRRRAQYADFNGKIYPARITLDKNFRSRKNVAEGINYLFGQLMTEDTCGIDYLRSERLNPAAAFDAAEDESVELHLLHTTAQEENGSFPECQHIAETVRKILDSEMLVTDKNGERRRVRPRDICILMRSLTNGNRYLEALERVGVPAFYQKKGGFFSMREIRVMVSLLEILNNPLLDVPLCACLLSPIWGFTPDELAQINLHSHETVLFRRLRAFQSPKCRAFLADYEALKRLSTVQTPAALLRSIYAYTGFEAIAGAMAGGENRKLNLLLLLRYAEEYGEIGKNSLSGFLRYLEKLRENEENVEAATGVSEYADVVRIMTIHKSKGLEFPVVILAKCGAPFNRQDQIKKMLIHPDLLLGLKIYDRENRRTFESVPYIGTKLAIGASAQAEELRVLYVALTRAKEKLIFVGGGNGQRTTDGILKKSALAVLGETGVPAVYVREASCYLDWISAACMQHPQAAFLREAADVGTRENTVGGFDLKVLLPNEETPPETVVESEPTETVKPDEALFAEIDRRVQFQYRDMPLAVCPGKVSASALNEAEHGFTYFAAAEPAFLGKSGLTPAERGTATHRFAEVCDFQNAKDDLESEILRLQHTGFLREEECDVLDREALHAFLHSDFLARLQNAERVYREQKFTVLFPANEVVPTLGNEFSDEQITVQGIIDCAFIENGEIVVVDYKTDRVKTAQELAERYIKQLSVYKRAAEELFCLPVKETLLYSFTLKRTVSVNI
ncbi:MAG: helicase-exonuclease AddAB subunit AddA [Candidatus Fimenecus sp.]